MIVVVVRGAVDKILKQHEAVGRRLLQALDVVMMAIAKSFDQRQTATVLGRQGAKVASQVCYGYLLRYVALTYCRMGTNCSLDRCCPYFQQGRVVELKVEAVEVADVEVWFWPKMEKNCLSLLSHTFVETQQDGLELVVCKAFAVEYRLRTPFANLVHHPEAFASAKAGAIVMISMQE